MWSKLQTVLTIGKNKTTTNYNLFYKIKIKRLISVHIPKKCHTNDLLSNTKKDSFYTTNKL